ncbi:hypothetical protein BDY17DRAFT_301302 [Neohortaea acidophila]|uniref:Uncharacterized protein n=1 Tax=Neohortaea acidophila TaxID=245834 RepID=A0A6A6PN37_9PEZI|nr:uncharacterized protein BDY17DRAFT_301302 [Neohortaea acidophila]KAF2481412.1 hypothetical protein BDY17DRAFT_301302 [Neohortaea acidophila]
MLDRILVADQPSSDNMLAWGLTCRAMRWSPGIEDYVFNGRIGTPISTTAISLIDDDVITSTEFTFVGAKSSVDGGAMRGEHALAVTSNHATSSTAVQQFLEGMSEVQPETPDYMPMPPQDAESFQRRNNVSMPRRARGPLHPVPTPVNSDSESSDDSDTDTESSAQPPHLAKQPPARNQPGVPPTKQANNQEHHNWDLGLSARQAAIPLRPATEASPSTKGSASTSRTHKASGSSETNARSSSATNLAQWSTDTQLSPRRRLNRRGIVRRDAPSVNGQNRYGPSSASTDVQSAPQADISAWQNVIHRDVRTGTLIDDTAPTTTSSIKPPPGYDQPPRMALTASQSPQPCSMNIKPDEEEPLIDLYNSGPENSRPFTKPSGLHNRPSRTDNQRQPGPKDYDDDSIIERLQDDELASNFKKYTMRQQKGKGNKHRNASARAKGSAAQPHADLPKPDPLPAPKRGAKKLEGETIASSSTGIPAGPSDLPVVEADSRMTKKEANIADSSLSTTPVGMLMQELLLVPNTGDTQIIVQFGTLLVKDRTDEPILTGVNTANAVEEKLQDGIGITTNFLPRMTTSDDDARFMLNLFGAGEARATVTYEIEIKNAEGAQRTITFDQTDLQNFLVSHTNNPLGIAYIHHPLRVWDAKVSIERPEVDVELMQTVRGFVASIQTNGIAPSFQALVPAGSFSVENVYAKRHFRKSIAKGIEVDVTEVQQLDVASTTMSPFNLQASVQPRATMIEGQRLWWEAGMYAQTADISTADRIHSCAATCISQIDGVGLNNSGPFRWAEIEEPVAEEKPFW